MPLFRCECGFSFEHENPGERQRVLVERRYGAEAAKEDFPMPPECQTCPAKKLVESVQLHSSATGKFYTAQDTYCLARNTEPPTRPLVESWDEASPGDAVLEIILQTEDYRRVFHIPVEGCVELLSEAESALDDIWEKLSSEQGVSADGTVALGMTSSTGDYSRIEIERDELDRMLVSARFVVSETKSSGASAAAEV